MPFRPKWDFHIEQTLPFYYGSEFVYIFTFVLIVNLMKKRSWIPISCLLTLAAILMYSCVKDVGRVQVPLSPGLCDSLNVKYSTDIQQIMATRCATSGCHDGGSFSTSPALNSYVSVSANADKVEARAVIQKDMPPTGPLPDSLIQKLKCWLDAGAPNN